MRYNEAKKVIPKNKISKTFQGILNAFNTHTTNIACDKVTVK